MGENDDLIQMINIDDLNTIIEHKNIKTILEKLYPGQVVNDEILKSELKELKELTESCPAQRGGGRLKDALKKLIICGSGNTKVTPLMVKVRVPHTGTDITTTDIKEIETEIKTETENSDKLYLVLTLVLNTALHMISSETIQNLRLAAPNATAATQARGNPKALSPELVNNIKWTIALNNLIKAEKLRYTKSTNNLTLEMICFKPNRSVNKSVYIFTQKDLQYISIYLYGSDQLSKLTNMIRDTPKYDMYRSHFSYKRISDDHINNIDITMPEKPEEVLQFITKYIFNEDKDLNFEVYTENNSRLIQNIFYEESTKEILSGDFKIPNQDTIQRLYDLQQIIEAEAKRQQDQAQAKAEAEARVQSELGQPLTISRKTFQNYLTPEEIESLAIVSSSLPPIKFHAIMMHILNQIDTIFAKANAKANATANATAKNHRTIYVKFIIEWIKNGCQQPYFEQLQDISIKQDMLFQLPSTITIDEFNTTVTTGYINTDSKSLKFINENPFIDNMPMGNIHNACNARIKEWYLKGIWYDPKPKSESALHIKQRLDLIEKIYSPIEKLFFIPGYTPEYPTISKKYKTDFDKYIKTFTANGTASTGGKKEKGYSKTEERLKYKGRKYIIYKGRRGGMYIRMKGEYRSIQRLTEKKKEKKTKKKTKT